MFYRRVKLRIIYRVSRGDSHIITYIVGTYMILHRVNLRGTPVKYIISVVQNLPAAEYNSPKEVNLLGD